MGALAAGVDDDATAGGGVGDEMVADARGIGGLTGGRKGFLIGGEGSSECDWGSGG